MDVPKTIGIVLLLYLLGYLLYLIYYAFGLFQFNPFARNVLLTQAEKRLLWYVFPISRQLSEKNREKWYGRIGWFLAHKKFKYKVEIEESKKWELILAATASFLTLGLRDYRMWRSLFQIILRPEKYYSSLTQSDHWGEYHPGSKTIVFSVDRLVMGFREPHDNLNLAYHEFAHSLCVEMMRANSWEARRFRVGLRKIKVLFEDGTFKEKLKTDDFFREYGQTNLMEFFSVAIEGYMENHGAFAEKYPQLHYLISRMLNFRSILERE
ncbi:MAG: zinc-dependent peptidase [Flavobacteriaceae bacterium]